jgi:hypothetical protein
MDKFLKLADFKKFRPSAFIAMVYKQKTEFLALLFISAFNLFFVRRMNEKA